MSELIGALLLASLFSSVALADSGPATLPKGFVDVKSVIPNIVFDLRYHGANNFIGRPIAGYEAPRLILTEPAARALASVQAELRAVGLGLLVYDAYRPTTAVADFVEWAKDLSDTDMKARFSPDVRKSELFREGYIATRSSHSRGSTVDLAIVSLAGMTPKALDMGTGFDLFSPRSWPNSLDVPAAARAHRLLLREVMTRHGFVPYEQEWWHFTLSDEPHPDTYFAFPVR